MQMIFSKKQYPISAKMQVVILKSRRKRIINILHLISKVLLIVFFFI